jgi:hypothetical protein
MGWDLHEIAHLAGHQNLDTTKRYVHLSARDLTERFRQTMNEVHAWRLQALSGMPAGRCAPAKRRIHSGNGRFG